MGPARIEGRRFAISSRGYATILRNPNSAVHGVLWALTRADEFALDMFEGFPDAYGKEPVNVIVGARRRHRAFAYVSTDAHAGEPHREYLEAIVEAAIALEFPPDYIEELRGWFSPAGRPALAAPIARHNTPQ